MTKEKDLLIGVVANSKEPDKLLKVLGNAWGISCPQMFEDEINRRNI